MKEHIKRFFVEDGHSYENELSYLPQSIINRITAVFTNNFSPFQCILLQIFVFQSQKYDTEVLNQMVSPKSIKYKIK